MPPVHLMDIQGSRRSCLCRTKGQAKPWHDEVFQLLCRGLEHGHVYTQPKESCTAEALYSLLGMAVFEMFKDQN